MLAPHELSANSRLISAGSFRAERSEAEESIEIPPGLAGLNWRDTNHDSRTTIHELYCERPVRRSSCPA